MGSPLAAGVSLSYKLYQGIKGQAKVAVATITSNSQAVTTGLQAGSEYCWQVSAIANALESALSTEACKAFPFSAPGTVTITVK